MVWSFYTSLRDTFLVHLPSQESRDIVLIIVVLTCRELKLVPAQSHRFGLVTAALLALPCRRIEVVDDGAQVNYLFVLGRGVGDTCEIHCRLRRRLLVFSHFAKAGGDHRDANFV